MTFYEALKELDECTDDFDAVDATQLVKKLRATYAPTIKMTKAEQVMLLNYLEMSSFREFMEVVLYQDDLYQTLSDEEIAQAWLHPETIKVVDNDV